MKPIALIAGAGNGDGSNIVAVIQSLGRDVFVIPDTDTPWVDATTIDAFIDANGIAGCHLIGCSLGGTTAAHYAKHLDTGRISAMSTLDSPLVATQQDGYFKFVYTLTFGKKGWLWSGSPFMKALRDPCPAYTCTQWMNDYQDGVGGFLQAVLPTIPFPHFDQPHLDLYTDAAVWQRILETSV